MIPPALPPWIEESDQFAGARVESGEIRTFELIAAVAGKREVVELVITAMLAGDDVLHLVL